MRVICNKEISKHINNITKHRMSTILFKVTGEDILLTAKQRRHDQRACDPIVHVTRCSSATAYCQLSP